MQFSDRGPLRGPTPNGLRISQRTAMIVTAGGAGFAGFPVIERYPEAVMAIAVMVILDLYLKR